MGSVHPAVSEICVPQSLDPICGKFDKFLAHGQAHMGQMGKWRWRCTTTGLDNSTELWMEKIHQAVTKIWVPQVWQPPAHIVTTIPLQPGGLRGNNWYHFHLYFNYHLMYFQLKTNSVGINEVSVVCMANYMCFIQWIITSCYQDDYELYRNNSVCIKIACIWSCSHILSRFNWCCKIQLCYDENLAKLMQHNTN